jgi:hypothetical protein
MRTSASSSPRAHSVCRSKALNSNAFQVAPPRTTACPRADPRFQSLDPWHRPSHAIESRDAHRSKLLLTVRKSLICRSQSLFRKISALDQDFVSDCRHSVVRGRRLGSRLGHRRSEPGWHFPPAGFRWPGQDGQRNQGRFLVSNGRGGNSRKRGVIGLGRDAVPLSSRWRPRLEGTLAEVANFSLQGLVSVFPSPSGNR